LIVGRKFTRALEIGTSSGHSAIWIAWALSKTGGRLITVEIDPAVRRKALRNFREAGIEAFIDSRLGDAHRLVSELQGPFDFIFLDADKEWYPRYFRELEPKLLRGGCFTAHNACNSYPGIRELLELLRSRADFRTTIDRSSSSCISVSCRPRSVFFRKRPMPPAPWKILSSERRESLRIFGLRVDRAVSPRTAAAHDFYILESADWVNVIPLTPEREVVLIRQYRHGT
nr:class I SAM-dependent methyltransferase [Desulfobacterales bacterium]